VVGKIKKCRVLVMFKKAKTYDNLTENYNDVRKYL